MQDRLSVAIDGPAVVDAPARFKPTDDFVLGIDNQGRATHVHVAVTGSLETTDGAPDANHFVDSEDTLELFVSVDEPPAEGTVTVAAGHGADEITVPVEVVEPGRRTAPEPDEAPDDTALDLSGNRALVAATAVGALLLAIVSIALIQNLVVILGALAVIAATALGIAYLLLQ